VTDPVDVLFDDYVVDILTIVSENPGIRKYTLYEELGKTTSKPRLLTDKLIAAGLLDQTPGENKSIKLISLTEEGERILALIQAIKSGKSIEPTNHGAPKAVRDSVRGS